MLEYDSCGLTILGQSSSSVLPVLCFPSTGLDPSSEVGDARPLGLVTSVRTLSEWSAVPL